MKIFYILYNIVLLLQLLKTNVLGRLILISVLVAILLNLNFTESYQSELIESNSFDQTFLSIKLHRTSVDIVDTSKILVTETYVIQNKQIFAISSVSLWINNTIDTLTVEDVEGVLDADWTVVANNSHLLNIDLRYNLEEDDQASFDIKYNLRKEFLEMGEESPYFRFDFLSTISHATLCHQMRILLPEGYQYYENLDTLAFYPQKGNETRIGRRLGVEWTCYNITPADEHPYFIVNFYQTKLPEPRFPSLIFSLGIITGIVVGCGITAWVARYIEKRSVQKIGTSLLSENQLELLRIILGNNGKVSQKSLCELTGFSKSKISRNIVPLEERGLLRREKWGRTYVVYITDSGKKVIE